MKLILFDIDGTLLHVRHEVGLMVVRHVLEQTYGQGVEPPQMEFHGKTDGQIFLELCEALGDEPGMAETRVEAMGRLMLDAWSSLLQPLDVTVLPGVVETLDSLACRSDVVMGVLTGNLAASARMKLAAAGLDRYFHIGSYGSDAIHRRDLPPIALERANALNGHAFSFSDVLIVGDSHRDIDCARAWGIRSFIVATGAMTVEQLQQYSPDALVESMADNSYIFDFLNTSY